MPCVANRNPARKSSKRSPRGAASLFGFLLDCETVIGLRLLRITAGGGLALRETSRMIGEKFETAVEAQLAACAAIASGEPARAFDRAAGAYRRRVRANRRRLTPS
jgi:hypothetical protein